MAKYKSEFLQELDQRGYIHQITDAEGLDAKLSGGPVTAYIGFDCTAPSLHVGSLVQIMMLRHLQRAGHRVIALMGGGTTLIGDPSGRDESRKLLTAQDIEGFKASIRSIFMHFLDFGNGAGDGFKAKHPAVMLDNYGWLKDLNYMDFLRDIGPHFTINRMLTFDSVKLRLDREQPLTFLEFNYMILQAYDFLQLARKEDCILQMGGSDQWGNIVNGMELARRMDGKELYGLTSPLITTADGAKMGKTAKGAIWLNEASLPAYDYYQFWRNCQDGDVGRFLRLFTELPLAEIERLEKLEGQEINEAKKILALEATALCRGRKMAEKAAETAQTTFEAGGLGKDLPHIEVSEGTNILDAYVDAGLTKSKGEARRLIQQGGARLNDEPLQDIDLAFESALFEGNEQLKLSAGKKRHAIITLKKG